jgi:hypothetical protein
MLPIVAQWTILERKREPALAALRELALFPGGHDR